MVSCPSCAGPHIDGHPAGAIVFRHRLECELRDRDDATVAADRCRMAGGALPAGAALIAGGFVRPVTVAERELLAVLGLTAGDDTMTTVQSVTDAILCRSWPDLATDSQ